MSEHPLAVFLRQRYPHCAIGNGHTRIVVLDGWDKAICLECGKSVTEVDRVKACIAEPRLKTGPDEPQA